MFAEGARYPYCFKILRLFQNEAKLKNHCSKLFDYINSLCWLLSLKSYQTIPDHMGRSIQFLVLILCVTDDNSLFLIYLFTCRPGNGTCNAMFLVPVYTFSSSSCPPSMDVLPESVLYLLLLMLHLPHWGFHPTLWLKISLYAENSHIPTFDSSN